MTPLRPTRRPPRAVHAAAPTLHDATTPAPLWRDVHVLAWAFQLLVLAVVVAVVGWLWDNFQANSER